MICHLRIFGLSVLGVVLLSQGQPEWRLDIIVIIITVLKKENQIGLVSIIGILEVQKYDRFRNAV